MYDARQKIRLLEPIVMFLAYSRYRLCEESIEKFDPKICNQHLQECLTGVLCCYEELDGQESSAEPTIRELERRCFIECLYQVFNLGSPESFTRALSLPDYVRQDATFKLCFGLCLAFQQGNLYRVLMALPQLPHILCALAATKLQAIRRYYKPYILIQKPIDSLFFLQEFASDFHACLQQQTAHGAGSLLVAFTVNRWAGRTTGSVSALWHIPKCRQEGGAF